MREFRKKQKRLKSIMQALVITTAVYFFVYIGIEPTLAGINDILTMVVAYIGDGLIIVCLIILFAYYSRYGKSDRFLESIEYELSDVGYYFTARDEKDIDSYVNAVTDDLTDNGFSLNVNEAINDFEFDAVCRKRAELFYIYKSAEVDKNDVLAYLDEAMYDVTAVNVRRRANGVVLFICDKADDESIAISKMISPLGKKEQIKFAIAIVEISTGRVYFLGNRATKCQQMIVNYVLNCEIPIKDKYKGNERLPFQDALEEHMRSFNIKSFNDGTFFAH